MKKSMWVMVALMLMVAIFPTTSQAALLQNMSWRAEYYDNPGLSGSPKISIIDAQISHNWGLDSPVPEIPADHFSVRWTGRRHFDQGTYLFLLTVDDGARVWLDGRLIIDAWDIGQQDERRARVYVDRSGDHEIQVAYFEHAGRASIDFKWIQLGDADDIVGAWEGSYFTNKDLAGQPVLARQDAAINFAWNGNSPDPKVTRDNFSVRWTRSIYLSQAGRYIFKIQHDDGMRIFVDGKVIYEAWFDQPVSYQVRKIPLAAGYRNFVVEYYDHLGDAIARVDIEGDPGAYDEDNPGSGGAGIIVDNTSERFRWGGPAAERHSYGGGYGDSFYWTYNENTTPVNFGTWRAPVSTAGNYEVFAYIPGDRATATQARYRILHFGQRSDRMINQSNYHNAFVSLGTYYFGGNGDEAVILYDNTGENPGSTQLAFDAIKFMQR